ncbi:helix-turn-helix transcriptional regulator [Acinetobacter sp. ME22]|uniref:helix-turn-helix domain-containing protein n=1 Tax=Acinetobacter sp. ME22 TaxID=2904802 RepID=UPI001EDAA316|nr:helix-turn-helix transcriptional regulator [Acinetobacter sp. ME22]MCG2575115.1 helix-turn-helix transcriptional regulator [Acinetobacter sp. ME22]
MLNHLNCMKVFNELDDIYMSKKIDRLNLLSFLKDKVYDSPMIYWNINSKNEINYDCSLGIDDSFIQLYNSDYIEFDRLHPKRIGHQVLNQSNVMCELDYIDKETYERSTFYNEFLKKQDAYNVIQLHLTHKDKAFGIINFLRNKNRYNDYLTLSFITKIISTHEFYNNREISDEINRYDLTRRENEIFNLLKSGYSYKDISNRLFISLNTTKTHAKNIFVKLNIKSRYELNGF